MTVVRPTAVWGLAGAFTPASSVGYVHTWDTSWGKVEGTSREADSREGKMTSRE
jgi:hypothetical protein